MKSFHIKFRFWLSTRRFVGRGRGALLVGHYRILVSTYSCLDIGVQLGAPHTLAAEAYGRGNHPRSIRGRL